MKKRKIDCLDIEIALMSELDFRRNLIVPNVSAMMRLVGFETDILMLTTKNYATGYEIKVSLSDLKADFKKPQHAKMHKINYAGKTGYEWYFGKFKHFYYVVPEELEEAALQLIPDFCGLYVVYWHNVGTWQEIWNIKIKQIRQSKTLFLRKWTDKERYEIARLGAMRVFNLKRTIKSLKESLNDIRSTS